MKGELDSERNWSSEERNLCNKAYSLKAYTMAPDSAISLCSRQMTWQKKNDVIYCVW